MTYLGHDRFITDGRPITEALFDDVIDYAKAAASFAQRKTDGYAYLAHALSIQPNDKKPMDVALRRKNTPCWRSAVTFSPRSAEDRYYEALHADIAALDAYWEGCQMTPHNRRFHPHLENDANGHEKSSSMSPWLYLTLNKMDRIERMLLEHEERFMHSEFARIGQNFCGKELLFYGAGAAYEYYKDYFKKAKPVAMVLDAAYARPGATVDGLSIITPDQLTPEQKNLPVVLFCREMHKGQMLRDIEETFPGISDEVQQGEGTETPRLVECILKDC